MIGPVEIPLTMGYVASVDAADAELVLRFKWSASHGTRTVYAVRGIRRPDGRKTTQSMHRFLTGFAVTDHVNGDGLDNRRTNLRDASSGENNRNQQLRSNNTSGFKGVSWCKRAQKWRASIQGNGKNRHLGLYESPDLAALAYDDAARTYFGPFAALNFPRAGERAAITKAA